MEEGAVKTSWTLLNNEGFQDLFPSSEGTQELYKRNKKRDLKKIKSPKSLHLEDYFNSRLCEIQRNALHI